MLLSRTTVLLNVKRTFCDSTSLLTTDFFSSNANRIKCIDEMNRITKSTIIHKKSNPSAKVASVLIPLVNCDENGGAEPSLLYTVRSNKMRKHISQVAFPGNCSKFIAKGQIRKAITNRSFNEKFNEIMIAMGVLLSFVQVECQKKVMPHTPIAPCERQKKKLASVATASMFGETHPYCIWYIYEIHWPSCRSSERFTNTMKICWKSTATKSNACLRCQLSIYVAWKSIHNTAIQTARVHSVCRCTPLMRHEYGASPPSSHIYFYSHFCPFNSTIKKYHTYPNTSKTI